MCWIPCARWILKSSRCRIKYAIIWQCIESTLGLVLSAINLMSGVIHGEKGDNDMNHLYLLEAFEHLDQLDDHEKAVPCLKNMMLCNFWMG